MGFATAAALTFCTPATDAAAEPAAVVDAFLAASLANNSAGVARTLTEDALVHFAGKRTSSAVYVEVSHYLEEDRLPEGFTKVRRFLSRVVDGDRVEVLGEREFCRPAQGTEPKRCAVVPTELGLTVKDGCITHLRSEDGYAREIEVAP